MYYLNPNDDKIIARVIYLTFPDYTGKRVSINHNCKKINLQSYWSEGSRSYFAILRFEDNKVMSIPDNHPFFTPINGIENFVIPDNFVIVEHKIFCGKDLGIVIHTNQPAPILQSGQTELSLNQKIVLYSTRSFKSSYAGIKDFRMHEACTHTKITRKEYQDCKNQLTASGHLDKRGAITNEGRNAIESNRYNWPE